MTRGLLIVLEGCDRSGKTSLAKRLVQDLNGLDVESEYLSFPNRDSRLGKILDEYLKGDTRLNDRAVHLLFSADRWEKAEEMESRIRSGVSLVIDRYAYSGTAFSSAKGMPIEWCKSSDRGLPEPDLVCFLNVSAEEALLRADFGKERYEEVHFQEKVKKSYVDLFDESWKFLNTDGRSVDDLYQELFEAVKCKYKENTAQELGKLWL